MKVGAQSVLSFGTVTINIELLKEFLIFKDGQTPITDFIKRRGVVCKNCGLKRKTGGNDGTFAGTNEYAVCTGCTRNTKNEERETNNKPKEKTNNDDEETRYVEMVRKFVAKRRYDSCDETMVNSHKSKKSRNEKYENVSCGSEDSEDNEGVYTLPTRTEDDINKLWIREFRGVGLRRRILHDIWETPSDGLGRRFERTIIHPLFGRYNGVGESSSGARRNGRNGVFIIAEHEKHLHVIHDCAYAGSTCRCLHIQRLREYTTENVEKEDSAKFDQESIIPEGEITIEEAEKIEQRRRRISTGISVYRASKTDGQSKQCGGRKRTGCGHSSKDAEQINEKDYYTSSGLGTGRGTRGSGYRRGLRHYARKSCASSFVGPEYWKNCTNYFLKGRRRIYQYNVAGRAWVYAYEIRAVPIQRLCKTAQKSILDKAEFHLSRSDLWTGLSCVQNDDGVENSDNQGHNENQGGKNRKEKSNRLEKWLDSFIITPMKNIIYTGHWTDGPYKYLPKNKQILLTCFHNIQQKICDMSYRELFLKTRVISMNKLIYVAPWNTVSEYYYDIEDSVRVLEELLDYQFQKDKFAVYNFLKNLYYLVDKKIPKKNCICVVGPSCSGKNFFFDCLIHSCINFGQIGNFNKYDRFPLQDALQRRILLWNEPNFEPGSEEILKLLFGGDTCSARIKYEGDACILRTPIIVLTNKDCIPNETTFTSRVWKYYWNAAGFLKYLTKKPHPLSMFYLFFKHNILSKNNFKFEPWELSVIKNK